MVTVDVDERKIDSIFADLNQCHLPGAAVGIGVRGKPVYRKGFGLAHMELPCLLSPSTRMRIYSATKHFTCLAFMLLCEEGRASPDDTLGHYLPELHAVTYGVTMRQLMGNTGGLRDPHDLTWQFSGTGRPVSSQDLIAFYRNVEDVNFNPGTMWCYGNGGFLLLSAVIERISGRKLEDYLRERIFDPVGMHDSLLRRVDTDFVPNSATMHMSDGAGGFDRSYVGTALAGEGGMVSTVDDMLRWLAHMDAPHVGTEATWNLMKLTHVLENGCETGYGLGLMIGRYRGAPVIHHAGGGQGANSQMLKVPSAGLDIAVMVNRHDVSGVRLVHRILDACLNGLDAAPGRSNGPFPSGIFASPTTGRVLQLKLSSGNQPWIEDGRPIVVLDGFDLPVEPDRDGLLRPTDSVDYMKIAIELHGDQQRPHGLHFHEFGTVDVLKRLAAVQFPDVEAILGHYKADSSGTEMTISAGPAGPKLRTAGRFGSAEFTLECLADRIWRARSTTPMSWGGILAFSAGGSDVRFTSLRTRALPFRRCA